MNTILAVVYCQYSINHFYLLLSQRLLHSILEPHDLMDFFSIFSYVNNDELDVFWTWSSQFHLWHVDLKWTSMILPSLCLHPIKSSLSECDLVLVNRIWQRFFFFADIIKVSNKLNLN